MLDARRFDDAVPAFERALELNASSADAALGLGQSLERIGRFTEAAQAYRKGAAVDPKIANMLLELAQTLEERGDVDQALSLYREYLTANSDAVHVRERFGILLMNQKRYEEAITDLAPAVERKPTPANREALAQAFLMTGRRGEALRLLQDALQNDPSNTELLVRYANVLLHAGETEKAAQHYYTAVKRAPDHVDAWNGLAFTLYKTGELPGNTEGAHAGTAEGASQAGGALSASDHRRQDADVQGGAGELPGFSGHESGHARRGVEIAAAYQSDQEGPRTAMKLCLAAMVAATMLAAPPGPGETAPGLEAVKREVHLEKRARLAIRYAPCIGKSGGGPCIGRANATKALRCCWRYRRL